MSAIAACVMFVWTLVLSFAAIRVAELNSLAGELAESVDSQSVQLQVIEAEAAVLGEFSRKLERCNEDGAEDFRASARRRLASAGAWPNSWGGAESAGGVESAGVWHRRRLAWEGSTPPPPAPAPTDRFASAGSWRWDGSTPPAPGPPVLSQRDLLYFDDDRGRIASFPPDVVALDASDSKTLKLDDTSRDLASMFASLDSLSEAESGDRGYGDQDLRTAAMSMQNIGMLDYDLPGL